MNFTEFFSWIISLWSLASTASRILVIYGSVMALLFLITYAVSMGDKRTLRDVGVWAKPMKFMAATALFAWSTVWLAIIGSAAVSRSQAFNGIAAVVIVTSLFEVVYITYQAAQGAASHYNTSDPFHAMMFGLMGIAAVGLTASQAWLAWEIWMEYQDVAMSVLVQGVVIGLMLTFVLSTVGGFLLGGKQPPAGVGLPIVGWHLRGDIRPSHFLGVHAQQFVPLAALAAERFLGGSAQIGFAAATVCYMAGWSVLTWTGIRLANTDHPVAGKS
jgi:hypothetical protein